MRTVLVAALCLAALSCGPRVPAAAPVAPIPRVIIPASLPWWFEFCVENPDWNTYDWRPHSRLVCRGTVDDLRRDFAQLRAAEPEP